MNYAKHIIDPANRAGLKTDNALKSAPPVRRAIISSNRGRT